PEIFGPNFWKMMCFSSSSNSSEFFTSNRRLIWLLTLLTFWPPGPLLRDAEKTHSLSKFFCFIRSNRFIGKWNIFIDHLKIKDHLSILKADLESALFLCQISRFNSF